MKIICSLALAFLLPLAVAQTADYEKLAHEDRAVTANIAPYSVRADLSNIANLRVFKSILSPAEKAMLAQNAFAVTPTDYIQMFHVYEDNEYARPVKMSAFITVDSMLHTYHVFYDYSLRTVEETKLKELCSTLTEKMLMAARGDYSSAKNEGVKSAAERNIAFFAVAKALLDGGELPSHLGSAEEVAKADLASIKAHEGVGIAKSAGAKIDFTQFIPRGHYTRSEKLKRYFKAIMWYGNVGFSLPGQDIGVEPTEQALLIVHALYSDDEARQLWDQIYEPTSFYVGVADDLTPAQYEEAATKVFGKRASIDSFGDAGKRRNFVEEIFRLAGPRINEEIGSSKTSKGKQFRFMGQRFIPDSRVLEQLTDPHVRGRMMPTGLDILAALGSERAMARLRGSYGVDKYWTYAPQMALVRAELSQMPSSTWTSNLYFGWLWTLQSEVHPTPTGYPTFMESPAWEDKSLLTALGSWTELRHDTVLYAKQTTAESGDEYEEELPKGYVEPNLEVWSKLDWLNSFTKEGLSKSHLLGSELGDVFDRVGDWISFCRKISLKELAGENVSQDEFNHMEEFGPELEALQQTFAGGDMISDADKDMAVVADVYTDSRSGTALEEGTGHVGQILVVVPIQGKLYLTRGAMFTQYEFSVPASERMDDQQWRRALNSRHPKLADWTKSFAGPFRKSRNASNYIQG